MATILRQCALADILLRRGLVLPEQLATYQSLSHGSERALRQAIDRDQLLSDAVWAEVLAEQCTVPFHPLDGYRVDFERFASIPVDAMRQFHFVPIEDRDGSLTIAVADPHDLRQLDYIERLVGHAWRLVVAPKGAIVDALQESERSAQMVARVRDEFRPLLVRENEQGEEVLSSDKIQKDQSPVVQLVDTIVLNALQKRASDIHLEPADGVTEVKYRIDGVLYLAMEPLDLKFHNPLVSRIKVMSELDIAERRVPQDGRFKLRLERRTIDFRVSVMPSAFGESVVIRILAKDDMTSGQRGIHLDGLEPAIDEERRR